MMHFSDTKPDDFFTVDPRGILVKLSINSAINFDPTNAINLSASIEDNEGQRKVDFPLEIVNQTTTKAVQGIFSYTAEENIYLLKLAPLALDNLKVLQQERTSGISKRIGLTAGVNFSSKAENGIEIDENTVLSVALKLTALDDFITLIDRWEVEVGTP
jgi:hypothetical protein